MEIWERREKIDDHIEEVLEQVEFTDPVDNLVIGDRARSGDARPPAIWVMTDESPVEAVTSISEQWTLSIVVAGVVMGTDPRDNRVRSERMAGEAAKAVLRDRTLGGLVRDVRRTGFSPGMPRVEDGQQIYGAGHILSVYFQHQENV